LSCQSNFYVCLFALQGHRIVHVLNLSAPLTSIERATLSITVTNNTELNLCVCIEGNVHIIDYTNNLGPSQGVTLSHHTGCKFQLKSQINPSRKEMISGNNWMVATATIGATAATAGYGAAGVAALAAVPALARSTWIVAATTAAGVGMGTVVTEVSSVAIKSILDNYQKTENSWPLAGRVSLHHHRRFLDCGEWHFERSDQNDIFEGRSGSGLMF